MITNRTLLVSTFTILFVGSSFAQEPSNPRIDYDEFARQVIEVAKLREGRRISEQNFLEKSSDPKTIVLDARSRERFDLLHIAGAVNLSLPDMTAAELEAIIPTKDTPVLIYCNNNFRDDPVGFPTKIPAASLNVHTFNVLHSYGYTNIFELAPLLNISDSILDFDGARASEFARK